MLFPKSRLKKVFAHHPQTAEKVWRILQAIPLENLLGEGRVYGGGLHKLEPKELLSAPVQALAAHLPHAKEATARQMAFN